MNKKSPSRPIVSVRPTRDGQWEVVETIPHGRSGIWRGGIASAGSFKKSILIGGRQHEL